MAAFRRLLGSDGNFFIAGDQASPLPGWMEGAMMSAHYVIEQMAGRIDLMVADTVPVQVPDSVALTQGLV
jgi:monoamine oxidase